ncbi:MAG: urease accessory protein UreF [Paracoccaceae bacterium]
MSTDLLTLAQWLSPAYPIGAFAYSHGLEAAIGSGLITNGAELQDWLKDVICHGSGRNDCILLYAAYACATTEDLEAVDATGRAFAATSERILETSLQGAAFGQVTGQIWGNAAADYIYPVSLGAAAAHLGLDRQTTASMYCHAMVGNLVSCAQRLMGLGQTDAQTVVAALAPMCAQTATDTLNARLDDLHSTAFWSDIAAMHHETQQPRIFRT